MFMRMLREDESLDSVWDEMVFTESQLNGDEQAKELTPLIAKLIARLEVARSGQMGARREEVASQAAVASADYRLDEWVRCFDRTLSDVVKGNKESPRYRRYFTAAPWTIIRLGLESELSRIRGWVDSLASEPEQILKDLGTRLAQLVAVGDAALEQRRKAVNARSDHRVREITSLIEDINAARVALYGSLASKAQDAGLPPDWPSHFFRHLPRPAKIEAAPAPGSGPAPT